MSDIVKILPYSVDMGQTIEKTELHTLFVMGDKEAHRFELEVSHGIVKADLTGCTVTGYFTNFKEKTTIQVDGKAEGSKVIVTLSKPCYALHGQFALTIQIKSDDVEASIFMGEGYMRTNKAEKIVYEDYVIYDVDTLLAQIAEMKTATENANEAAAAANAAAEHAPYINAENYHWMAWDKDAGKYVDTGVAATGPKGDTGSTPYIGSNGNWWIGNTDTGTKAQGPAGQNGTGSGTVTGVKLNGQTYGPNTSGVVELPEMGGSKVELSNTTPKPLGSTASPGTGTLAAREDHVHKLPTPQEIGARPNTWTPSASDVGALPSGGTAADASKLGGNPASDYLLRTEGLQMELIWENNSPFSSIGAFDVEHDMTPFDYVRILFNSHNTSADKLVRAVVDIVIGSTSIIFINCGITSSGKMWWAKRRADVTSDGVHFYGSSYLYVDEEVAGNEYAIPHKIYGVKGVKPIEGVS